MRPLKGTYPDYFENYIPLVEADNVIDALELNRVETLDFFNSIPPEKEDHAYSSGKWTVKEVLNHLCDTERIFAYRALRFARNDDKQPLSFEQDHYVIHAACAGRQLSDLVQEFETVRKATLSLYKSFNVETLLRSGLTAAGRASVLAIGFTVCGHNLHHIKVVRDRYLAA